MRALHLQTEAAMRASSGRAGKKGAWLVAGSTG